MTPVLQQERDAQKKMIGEYLKAADRYIKASDYPKALEEVTKALGVEPNNMYALAYNERVKVAIEAARKKEEEDKLKKLAEEQKKAAQAPVPPPPPPAVSKTPEPPKAPEPLRAPSMPDAKPVPVSAPPAAAVPAPAASADDMVAKIKKDASDVADKKAEERIELLKREFDAARRKLEEDVVQFASQAKAATEEKAKLERTVTEQLKTLESLRTSQPAASSQPPSIEILKVLLAAAWMDGVISQDDRILLQAAQSFLGVNDADFAALEAATRSSSYLGALREVWKDGLATPEEADYLEQLRRTLNVSAEEHLRLEAQIRKESSAKK
jgi:hypothetical protein